MPLSFANLPDSRGGGSDLDFGSLPDANGPSFGDVQAGVSSSPSFGNVQGGADTTSTGPLGYYAQKFSNDVGNVIGQAGNAPEGALETAANFESQGVAIPAGGAVRLGLEAVNALVPKELQPIPLPNSDEAQQAVTEGLTYQPQSSAGQEMTAATQYPFQKLAEGADYLGQKTLDTTGSPALAAAVSTAVQVVPLALGGKVVEGFTPRAPRAAEAVVAAHEEAQAAGKPSWEATQDALQAIQESDSRPPTANPGDLNLSPEETRPPTPENADLGNQGNPSVKKTDSEILGSDSVQVAKDADLEAAQRAAWGGDFSHLPDTTPEVAQATDHPLFADLVPETTAPEAKVEAAAPAKEIGRWDTNLDTGQRERVYDTTDLKEAVTRSNLPVAAMKDFHSGDLTVGKLFDHVINDTSGRVEPETATLAKYLQAAGKRFGGLDVKIDRYNPDNIVHTEEKPVSRMGSGGGMAAGYYDPFNNAIRLDRDAPNQHIMLHEATHALTNRAVIRGRAGKLGGDAQKAYNTLSAVVDGFKQHINSKPELVDLSKHYGLTNLDEYLAEFYTNPKFRDQLKNINLDDVTAKSAGGMGRAAIGAIRNVYQATVRGIRNMLGMPEKAETALDASFAAGHQFLGNLKPEDLGGLRGIAVRASHDLPEMGERVSREDIDKQAQAALSKGANPDAVNRRQMDLYRQNGHEPAPTSTKNAVRDAERVAEHRDPIIKEAAQSNQTTLDAAKATLEKNPNRPNEVMRRLTEDGVHSISAEDEAVLLIHKAALRNTRDEASKTINDPGASEQAKTDARVTWGEMEARINLMDNATEASGREWGRLGQFRQRMIRSDYSLDAMERKRRTVLGGRPLTPEESKAVKTDFDAVQKAQKEFDASQAKVQATHENSGVKYTYENLVKEMASQLKTAKKKGTFLETLKANADESRDWFKKNLSKSSAGVDPTAFFHLARIGAYHIANGAVKFADWVGRMKAELGAHFSKVEDSMPAVFKAAKEQHAIGATEAKPRLKAKASLDPNNITHKDVYDLARAHIINGVHGEDAVMKAVHGDLKEHGLSERDVRRLFSEYGEAKFPSKEADKTELREIRSLVQMQESIDRIHEELPALKSGVQRDKATAIVREKRRQLNDLLKDQEAKNGMSPEKLVTYQEMRARNLRNQIEDLQKEIATGEKKVRKPTPADSQEVQALKVERDHLKDELKKIDLAKNPPPSPEEKYQATRGKQLQRELNKVYDRIRADDYTPRKVEIKELNSENQKLSYKLYQAKDLFNRHQLEIQMAQRPVWKKALGGVGQGFNLARAIETSIDLSATLRQGGFIAYGHPVRAMKALIASIKAGRGEEYAHAIQKDIESRPNFYKYKAAGLELTLGSGHELTKHEEQFMSRWLERSDPKEGQNVLNKVRKGKDLILAPVRASERIFRTFINKLRADSFDEMVATLARTDKPTTEEMKAIASYVNVATGRGDIGKNSKWLANMSTIFFAPRLVKSRFDLLTGQPFRNGNARTRQLIAKEYARYLTGIGLVIGLGYLAHLNSAHPEEKYIEFDPRSANFMKMHFGNTWIDPLSGLSQVTTFLAKEITGERKTQKGQIVPERTDMRPLDLFRKQKGMTLEQYQANLPFGAKPITSLDTVYNFARSKLAPVPGFIANRLNNGKNVAGQQQTVGNDVLDITTPMSLQNIKQIMQEHGVSSGMAMTLLDMLGMSVQQRQPYQKTPPPQKKP